MLPRQMMVGSLLIALLSVTHPSLAAEPAASPAHPLIVLDGTSVWRTFHLMKPPVIQMDDGPKPVLLPPGFDWASRCTRLTFTRQPSSRSNAVILRYPNRGQRRAN